MNMQKLYTPQEVADYLHLSRGTIYSLVSRGEIDSYKLGRARRFSDQQISEFVARDRLAVIDMTTGAR